MGFFSSVGDAFSSAGNKVSSGIKKVGSSMHVQGMTNLVDFGTLVKNPLGYARNIHEGVMADVGHAGTVFSRFKSGDWGSLAGQATGDTLTAVGASKGTVASMSAAASKMGGVYATYKQSGGDMAKFGTSIAGQYGGEKGKQLAGAANMAYGAYQSGALDNLSTQGIGNMANSALAAGKSYAQTTSQNLSNTFNNAIETGKNYASSAMQQGLNDMSIINLGSSMKGAISMGQSAMAGALQKTPLAGLGVEGMNLSRLSPSTLIRGITSGGGTLAAGAKALSKANSASIGISQPATQEAGLPRWVMIAAVAALALIVLK